MQSSSLHAADVDESFACLMKRNLAGKIHWTLKKRVENEIVFSFFLEEMHLTDSCSVSSSIPYNQVIIGTLKGKKEKDILKSRRKWNGINGKREFWREEAHTLILVMIGGKEEEKRLVTLISCHFCQILRQWFPRGEEKRWDLCSALFPLFLLSKTMCFYHLLFSSLRLSQVKIFLGRKLCFVAWNEISLTFVWDVLPPSAWRISSSSLINPTSISWTFSVSVFWLPAWTKWSTASFDRNVIRTAVP